jgi:hypothetical protein
MLYVYFVFYLDLPVFQFLFRFSVAFVCLSLCTFSTAISMFASVVDFAPLPCFNSPCTCSISSGLMFGSVDERMAWMVFVFFRSMRKCRFGDSVRMDCSRNVEGRYIGRRDKGYEYEEWRLGEGDNNAYCTYCTEVPRGN